MVRPQTDKQPNAAPLLRQIEPYLYAARRGGPDETVAHQGVVKGAVEVEVRVQAAVDDVAQLGMYLEIDLVMTRL